MYMFFWFFKQLYYCLRRIFKSGILLLIVFFIAFLFIFIKPTFAVDQIQDIYNEITIEEEKWQDDFALFCLQPALQAKDNSPLGVFWRSKLQPLFTDLASYDYDIYITNTKTVNFIQYRVCLYRYNDGTTSFNGVDYYSPTYNQTVSVNKYTNADTKRYIINYYPNNVSSSTVTTETMTMTIPQVASRIKSQFLLDFISFISGASSDYTFLLNSINNYLANISSNNDIVSTLNTIKTAINDIPTNPDYTEQLNNLSSQVNDMISSQEETNDKIDNLTNTITDTNIDNSSINLPTDNSNDITQEGLNGIFTSIYNAFCVGEPQDIVFPIPFTNKNITLQPNYVRSMLTSSGANWVITIIEAFWWYLISRFIIKDITNKITKIKSGNIENIENSNIKGDML